ncbi:MAG: bifunctional glutamate N-acetyltransferase/amino-acid acetyltransferase ArgJ [Planctomycetota bacterium]
MTVSLEWIADGDLLSVPGWRGSAVRCGIKPSGALDLALLRADAPCPAAAVFTRNALPAACVTVGRETLARSASLRSIAVNSGNANAMTGAAGERDARRMAQLVEDACGGPVIALSTGVIGVPLPMDRIEEGVAAASASLARDGHDVADAILTTDTVRKTCAVEVELPPHGGVDARRVRVGGMAKGSGMIHPDMATMLAFVATDAPVDAAVLREMLVRANDASFHEITVDGDTSTNDTVLLLAGPGTENTITSEDPRLGPLETAITAVMQRLARAIVLDGEGRTRVMELVVEGAADRDDARRVAETVACSSLVKTALAGGDPNWGRIVAAAANAGVALEGERLSLDICGMRVFEAGLPTEVDAARLDAAFSDEEVRVVLTLGDGPGRARRWTTDLSAEYVRINSEYTT